MIVIIVIRPPTLLWLPVAYLLSAYLLATLWLPVAYLLSAYLLVTCWLPSNADPAPSFRARRLPDGVRTSGVFTKGPHISLHFACFCFKCARVASFAIFCYISFTFANDNSLGGIAAHLRRPRLSRPRLEAGEGRGSREPAADFWSAPRERHYIHYIHYIHYMHYIHYIHTYIHTLHTLHTGSSPPVRTALPFETLRRLLTSTAGNDCNINDNSNNNNNNNNNNNSNNRGSALRIQTFGSLWCKRTLCVRRRPRDHTLHCA